MIKFLPKDKFNTTLSQGNWTDYARVDKTEYLNAMSSVKVIEYTDLSYKFNFLMGSAINRYCSGGV